MAQEDKIKQILEGLHKKENGTTVPQKTAATPQKTAVAPQKTAVAPQKTDAGPGAVSKGSSEVKCAYSEGAKISAGSRDCIVEKVIGSGSEGELYVVSASGRRYALKLYRKGHQPNFKVLPFLDKLAGKGYLVDTVDYGPDYELLEYFPEGNVAAAGLKGNAQAILAIALKTAMALDKLHKEGILHKDVKPANILIKDRDSWDTVLCDFGIADIMDAQGKCATTQVRTPIYAAPEVYSDTVTISGVSYTELSAKADFYSLGMTILSLWAGESAFLAKEHQMAIDKVKGRIAVPSDMPDPLARICRGLLIKNPAKRWDWEEIEKTVNGRDVPVEEDELLEDLNITFSASKHLFANTPEELVGCMVQEPELARKYLYRGTVEKWLRPYPELALEIQDIVEKRYPKDQDTGLMAAIYLLDPTVPLRLSGSSRKDGKAVCRDAVTLKDVGNFFNDSLPDPDTVNLLNSDTFVEWVRSRSADVAAKLPATKACYPTYMLRVQTVDPMSDINLINDSSDPLYAMTQQGIGLVLNEIYNIFWGRYRGNLDTMISDWPKKANAPLNRRIPLSTISNVVMGLYYPDEFCYLKTFFKLKGGRFTKQLSWYEHCVDYHSSDNKKKAGPKDERYLVQSAWMRIVKGFGRTPEYNFPGSGISIRDRKDLAAIGKDELQCEYVKGGLVGWLAVQYHEDPFADLSAKYSYERLLESYLEEIRLIDAKLEPVKRFDLAKKKAAAALAGGKARINGLNIRTALQWLCLFVLAMVPCLILLTMLVCSIIEHPTLDVSGLRLESFFWPVGLVVSVIIFFASDSDGCLIPIIGGAVSAVAVFFLIRILGAYVLYIFAAVVLAVLGMLVFYAVKFLKSGNAAVARRFSKPGFEENVLEPLYFAFSDETDFDSSLNGAFNDSELLSWKLELESRRKFIISFVVVVWILMGLSMLIPGSSRFDNMARPLLEKVMPAEKQE